MAVSAIISNLNGASFLPKLLESLKSQNVQLEIIVVDRESTDESHAILSRHPDVKVLSEPRLTGLVSGYARGVAVATHEHLFFCNEDMWFAPDCLQLLERQIDLSKRVAASDPWQWTYDGSAWIHGITRFQKKVWAINGAYPFRIPEYTQKGVEGDILPFPCAGAFLMHRQVYDEIGGWDTSFFLDNEDIDLFIRAWQQGWRCVAVPGAKVYHAAGTSNIAVTGSITKVGKRRYISSMLGRSVIIWKYFSPSHLWMALAVWFVLTANNLVKGRFETVTWDLKVLASFIARFGKLQAFRHFNRKNNQNKPGERFFTAPEFNI